MNTMVSKELADSSTTSVLADNSPLNVSDRDDMGVLIEVTDATNGDTITVNMVGGITADSMANIALNDMPLTFTVANVSGVCRAFYTLNVRGMGFIQVKDLKTSNAAGCTVTVYQGSMR